MPPGTIVFAKIGEGLKLNRRAVLSYLKKDYLSAIEDCQQVIEIVPWHFGAWHGLGLCWAALASWRMKRMRRIEPGTETKIATIVEPSALWVK